MLAEAVRNSTSLTWPDAVVLVAFFAVFAWIAWLAMRD